MLGLKGKKVSLSLSTLHGTNEQNSLSVNLLVRGVNETEELLLKDVIAVYNLPDLEDNIPTDKDLEYNLRLLDNVNVTCLKDKRIRLLIGANV